MNQKCGLLGLYPKEIVTEKHRRMGTRPVTAVAKGMFRNIGSEKGPYSAFLEPQPSPFPVHLAPLES